MHVISVSLLVYLTGRGLIQGLAEVALGCMCDLLVSLPHFNFRNNILTSLVPLMPSKKLDGRVSLLSTYSNSGP